jgi:putative endonuclease
VTDGRVVRAVPAVRPKDALGAYGERLAADHLRAAGMTVLELNWRCPIGELDIVARDGDVLVVCEVKTRSSTLRGHPLEAVTAEKAARLRLLAAAWIDERQVHPADVRVDLVGVVRGRSGGPSVVEHVRGVA